MSIFQDDLSDVSAKPLVLQEAALLEVRLAQLKLKHDTSAAAYASDLKLLEGGLAAREQECAGLVNRSQVLTQQLDAMAELAAANEATSEQACGMSHRLRENDVRASLEVRV